MPATAFKPFINRYNPRLEDFPTSALCIWWAMCSFETAGLSWVLGGVGKIFANAPPPRWGDMSALFHQHPFSAGYTVFMVSGLCFMWAVFGFLSKTSGSVLLRRLKGEKQADWRARTGQKNIQAIREKYFGHDRKRAGERHDGNDPR